MQSAFEIEKEPGEILPEGSRRAGRANKYAALLAAELQRQANREGRALCEEDGDDEGDEDDGGQFDIEPDNPEHMETDVSESSGDSVASDTEKDEDRQLEREERAAARPAGPGKDSSLFYLKKRAWTTRKPLRSTFDLDKPESPSPPSEQPSPDDLLKDGGLERSPKRSRQSAVPASSVAGSSTGPGTRAGVGVLMRREARKVRSTYRQNPNDVRTAPSATRAPASQKPVKKVVAPTRMTQQERMDQALEMEIENEEKLRDWLADEEKKRQDRRPPPKDVKGPKLVFLSGESTRRCISRLADDHAMDLVEMAIDPSVASAAGDSRNSDRCARTYLHLTHPPSSRREKMALLFGDHVDWSEQRPTSVKHELCVITGLPAKYKDPKTGQPYATVQAYKQIKFKFSPIPASDLALPPAPDSPPPARPLRRHEIVGLQVESDDDDGIVYLPPSPTKSLGGRSHKSTGSTGDELVMDSWA